MNSAFAVIALCIAWHFGNSDAGVTPAVSILFKTLASGNPPILSKSRFAEFVTSLRKSTPDDSMIDWWYDVLKQNPTEQKMIDWCTLSGELQTEFFFQLSANSKVNKPQVEALYDQCEKSRAGGPLTLPGMIQFVSKAFENVTEDSARTWYSLSPGFCKFDAQKICRNKEESLKETYLVK